MRVPYNRKRKIFCSKSAGPLVFVVVVVVVVVVVIVVKYLNYF